MKRLLILAAISAIVIGGVAMNTTTALAYRGDPSVQGPNYSAERHEAMEKAFENKDYEAWKNLMQGRGRVSQVVTKENFAKFAEAHALAEQGKLEEARKIRQELGLGGHHDSGREKGMGKWSR